MYGSLFGSLPNKGGIETVSGRADGVQQAVDFIQAVDMLPGLQGAVAIGHQRDAGRIGGQFIHLRIADINRLACA